MSISYLTFSRGRDGYEDFVDVLKEHMNIVHKLLHVTLGYDDIKIERLSFVDYKNSSFYNNFPFNKQLCINNTSTVDKFGFGRFAGYFFDVIIRGKDNNPKNIRIFYGINDENATPLIETDQLSNIETHIHDKETITILGIEQEIIKKGRFKYINIDGKLLSLTEARKLNKKKNIS